MLKGHHENTRSGLHLDPYLIRIQHVETDSELSAQWIQSPSVHQLVSGWNIIIIFNLIPQNRPITQCIIIPVKWTGNRKLKTKQLEDSPVWYMSLSVSLRSVRQANTWSIHHKTLFGLTDRLYEARAVNLGLKYHQWLLKTYLLQSALLGWLIVKQLSRTKYTLASTTKWNRTLDARMDPVPSLVQDGMHLYIQVHLTEPERPKATGQGQLSETHQLLKRVTLFSATGLGRRSLLG